MAGGGTAYVAAAKRVKELLEETEGDEKTGVALVIKALETPIQQIAANAGVEGTIILDRVLQNPDPRCV